MHPDRLFGMGPYLTLDDGGRCRGQFFDTVLERTVGRDRQRRVDFGLVSTVGASVDEARDDGASSSYGQQGSTRGRPGRSAEEGNKDPWNITNVLIDQQGGNPVPRQRTNHLLPGRRSAEDDLGTEAAPQVEYQPVDPGIVELSGGGCQGDARNRQPGAEKLPGAAVARGEDDATPALEGFEEIFDALQHAQILDVLRPRVPQPGDLGEHETEMASASALDGVSLALVQIGECDFEMGAYSLATSGQEGESGSAQDPTDRSREGQWESSSNAEETPEAGVKHEASGARCHGRSLAEQGKRKIELSFEL
jgi:hypothetical protein